MPAPDRFWLWWPLAGIVVLNAAFIWYMSPLGLGFRFSAGAVNLQIADGIYRFSYLILNPAMVIIWLALPLFHRRELAGFGWRLLGLTAVLLVGCIAAVFALL